MEKNHKYLRCVLLYISFMLCNLLYALNFIETRSSFINSVLQTINLSIYLVQDHVFACFLCLNDKDIATWIPFRIQKYVGYLKFKYSNAVMNLSKVPVKSRN